MLLTLFHRARAVTTKPSPIPVLAVVMLVIAGAARADWGFDGVPVCTAPGVQIAGSTVAGDALFVVCQTSNPYLVHVQRIDASGRRLWGSDGVPVAGGTENQYGAMGVPDGAGGIIVAFQNGLDLHAQRLDAHGVPQWGANGIPIALGSWVGNFERALLRGLIPDGSVPPHGSPAGATILWTVGPWNPEGPDHELPFTVWAQSIDGSGNPRWGAAGVQVSADTSGGESAPFAQITAVIASDQSEDTGGPTGAYIAWRSRRGDVHAQRLDAGGVPYWVEGGVPLSDLRSVSELAIAPVGFGRAIVLWSDTGAELFARDLSPTGPGWSANGVPIGDGIAVPYARPRVVPDGAGGVFVAWDDKRRGSDTGYDIYAQRINASGTPLWAAGGVPISAHYRHQFDPVVVADGAGGMVAAWTDQRSGRPHIYAQRLDASGSPSWSPDGVPVCTAAGGQTSPSIAADGLGGAYVAWTGSPRGTNTMLDLFAQHLAPTGAPAVQRLLLSIPVPNPSQGQTSVDFVLPADQPVSAAVHGVNGALVRALIRQDTMAAGRYTLNWDGRDDHGRNAPAGVYFLRVQAGTVVDARKVVLTR